MDYFTIWDKDVEEVTPEGIHYLGGFIDFAECAARWEKERGGKRCVGECCLAGDPAYILFYSDRLGTRIAFEGESVLKVLFSQKASAAHRLKDMKKKIEANGFLLSEKKK